MMGTSWFPWIFLISRALCCDLRVRRDDCAFHSRYMTARLSHRLSPIQCMYMTHGFICEAAALVHDVGWSGLMNTNLNHTSRAMNTESTRHTQYHASTDNSRGSSKKKTNYMAMAPNSWETGGGWLSERVGGAAIKTSTIPFAFACHVPTQHTKVCMWCCWWWWHCACHINALRHIKRGVLFDPQRQL